MLVAEIQVEQDGYKLIVNQSDMHSQLEMIFQADPGDTIFITLAEMTEDEYKNLPEFIGW